PADTQYQPYDDVSWALPIHYGIEAKRIADAKIKDVSLEPITTELHPPGRITGNGPVYLMKDFGQEAALAGRHRLAKFRIEIAEKPFKIGDNEYTAGTWIVPAQNDLRAAIESVSKELSLDFFSAPSVPDVPRHESRLPRLAVYHTWDDTQAVGWIRYTLDQQKIPYDYISEDRIRAGDLRKQYDVILYGHTSLSLQGQIHGIDKKYGPMPYTKTPQYPSHGVPDASEDITGGIGWAGMSNLEKFLNDGGILITLGGGCQLALDGGLVRGVRRGPGGVFTPGVEVRAKFARPDHPIAYGYDEVTSVFRSNYPVYDVGVADRRFIVLQWGTKLPTEEREETTAADKAAPPMLVSGGMRGDDTLEGRPAILDIPAGRGRVLAYNFNPLHRDLNHSDYRLLWNALLNWTALSSSR
ncbi:MAG TPA: hypothetical protein VFZ22_17215, partial [Pyrinomonadaceae bacterium]|nr:hypothetical protein [Pyrinomonadaceae bacterium]